MLARDAATFEQSKGTTNGLVAHALSATLPDGTPNGSASRASRPSSASTARRPAWSSSTTPRAFLLGKRGQGFRAMLELMNNARLGVAAQGIGIAEAAYRQARDYAAARVQFGAPIVQQPLVKSMLTLMAIHIAAARALLYRTCALIDQTEAMRRYPRSDGRREAIPSERALADELERNTQLIRFFTPLCKYYATEISNHVTRQAIQVHGGIGYMAESRVAPLPLRLDHHDDLRGHVRDPGELRAEGDGQGRAVRGARRGRAASSTKLRAELPRAGRPGLHRGSTGSSNRFRR